MINKINSVQGIQNLQMKSIFKAKETETGVLTAPENSVSFKGAEALANYNKPNVLGFDKSVLEVEPVLPVAIPSDGIGTIEGEKIYGSNGKLNSIVNRVGNTTTIYKASPDNDSVLESITIIDKKSGKVIKEQRNEVQEGVSYMNVTEFDSVTGKELRNTSFENGSPVYASKTTTNKHGLVQVVGYDYQNGHFEVYENSADNKFSRNYEFNKNKELINLYEHKNIRGTDIRSDINFYNGAVISSSQSKVEVLPNNMGREILADADVKPADLSVYPDSIEGEKTFYSNGSLESVTAGNLVFNYSPEGDITSIKDGNKTVEVKNNVTTITENLDENTVKTTLLFDNGSAFVDFVQGEHVKHITLHNDIPSYYSETNEGRCIKNFMFNEKGMLESARGDEI